MQGHPANMAPSGGMPPSQPPMGGGMYNFKSLPTLGGQGQLSAGGGQGIPTHPGSGAMGGMGLPASGIPTTNGGPQGGIGPGGGQLMGSGGSVLTPQQLAANQQYARGYARSAAASHTPIQPSMASRLGQNPTTSMAQHHQQLVGQSPSSMSMGGGGPMMMQINPSQLSTTQAALGSGGQMGPPTGVTAPGRMGGVVGPTNPTGQWMGRAGIGAGGPQRPPRYQQEPSEIVTKQKLQELIQQVAPNDRLEPEVEELLQDIAEDFVESVTTFACSLAKLRKSDCLDSKDVALHLERNWNLQIPGYSPELDVMAVSASASSSAASVPSLKRPLPEGHKQRLALVKKTMAMQRKREERERKERKQKEEKEKEKEKQQQQQQAEKPKQEEGGGPSDASVKKSEAEPAKETKESAKENENEDGKGEEAQNGKGGDGKGEREGGDEGDTNKEKMDATAQQPKNGGEEAEGEGDEMQTEEL